MRTVLRLLPALMLLLVGCASVDDIDMNAAESGCGQICARSYSECMSGFTFFPIQEQHQCTGAMRLCVKSFPAR